MLFFGTSNQKWFNAHFLLNCEGKGKEISAYSMQLRKIICFVRIPGRGFPGGAVVENLPANAGDTGSSPSLGRSHMLRSN